MAEDFMFNLTEAEKMELVANCDRFTRLRHSTALPHAFTEHGALMAANVLNSPKAVEVSVYVVRAFIQQRAMLAAHADLAVKLERIEKKLLAGLYMLQEHDDLLTDHDNQLEYIVETLREMQQQHIHRPIGFRSGTDMAE